MTGFGHNRRGKSLPCGFLFDRKPHYLEIQSEKGSNNIRKTVAGKLLYIYSPVSCTWLWKNNFPVGKKYFSSWGDMVLQLGSRFSAITAWIYCMNMRCKSSAGFGKSECKALFIESIMFSFACAPAHALRAPHVYNIMRARWKSSWNAFELLNNC